MTYVEKKKTNMIHLKFEMLMNFFFCIIKRQIDN